MTRSFRIGDVPSPHVLRPFDKREAITTAVAAEISGFSAAHVRRLTANYDLGRHIGGGVWRVSRIAWAMFLDNDADALAAYHCGDRSSDRVLAYYRRAGFMPLVADQAA